MYASGLNPKIEEIYPKVSFPVGRGTPSIHSLPIWEHVEWKSVVSGTSDVSNLLDNLCINKLMHLFVL